MKIIVIGLGSMGKRRTRLLTEHKDVEIIGVDSNPNRSKEASENFGISCFGSISEAVEQEHPTCAFVCTSPLSHAAIIKECLMAGLHVFTEINLVNDGYEENILLAKAKGLCLFLSSTFLYRKETIAIIEKVREERPRLNYIYHVGQYLPDWHPWESYNNYFIGNPRTNGCREIMAIDLPWIITAFGKVKNLQVLSGKNTSLNVNYNDNYLILLEHSTGAKGVFAVDVVARKPFRHIDIYGEHLQISWNGTPDSLKEIDVETGREETVIFEDASEHIEGYASFVTENPYREEIEAFLTCIKDLTRKPVWDFEKDLEVLRLIDQIGA